VFVERAPKQAWDPLHWFSSSLVIFRWWFVTPVKLLSKWTSSLNLPAGLPIPFSLLYFTVEISLSDRPYSLN
jgi:hypothetical protein